MTFISAIAGPSRLPWRSLPHLIPTTRRAASTDAATPSNESQSIDVDAEVAAELDDKGSRLARQKEKLFYGTLEGYKSWLKTGAANEFYQANEGTRARWLGGDVPYATNPSFRPPPPLSNDLQNTIYRHLKRGQKTVGQLAEQYNVSKARIEAIRKLKQVEDEFRRQPALQGAQLMKQEIPLQQAFHSGMESLLGTQKIPRNLSKGQTDIDRDSPRTRDDISSTIVEREEEERLDAGIGQGGAFGSPMQQERAEGMERAVWEFRSEEMIAAEKVAEAKAAASVATGAEKKVAEQDAAPETPDNVHVAEVKVEKKQQPSKTVKSGKNKYRFVDISK